VQSFISLEQETDDKRGKAPIKLGAVLGKAFLNMVCKSAWLNFQMKITKKRLNCLMLVRELK
jgi:Fe-S cluster biosynthesis and repair protein YggX